MIDTSDKKELKAVSFWLATRYEQTCRFGAPVQLSNVIKEAELIYDWINKTDETN